MTKVAQEHGHRPAADVTLRSAAERYGRRAVGVVLTGSGHDGVLGLIAIKAAGGLAIVQNPLGAIIPNMPQNAIGNDQVDLVVSVKRLPSVLMSLASGESVESKQNPRLVQASQHDAGTSSGYGPAPHGHASRMRREALLHAAKVTPFVQDRAAILMQ